MNKTIEGRSAIWFALFVLFAVNTVNFFDRIVIGAVGEPVRREFGLSDSSLGLLSTAFTLFYAFAGIPFGRLADKVSRKKVIAVGTFIWSLFTFASGLAQNYWQMFALRLGVGVGEASCSPAATSLIGDLFPTEKRSRAMSVFMLGLPIGIGLSFAVSGTIAQAFGWRAAFFVAGIPGLLLAFAALFIREPLRGASEISGVGEATRPGSPYRLILSSPSMRWLIISGIIHNFCLYALSSFMTPYMMRYHGLGIRDASLAAMLINGVFTLPGLLFGGLLGDAFKRRRADGGLILTAFATLLAIPFFAIAIAAGPQNTYLFIVAMGLAFALMYFYYSNVYTAIQDLTEPALRGTAMSIYFLLMYLLGGALGPYVVGLVSDFFTRRAARLAGVVEATTAALEPFRAEGLHTSLFIIPILAVALMIVLLLASRTTKKETDEIRAWMNDQQNV